MGSRERKREERRKRKRRAAGRAPETVSEPANGGGPTGGVAESFEERMARRSEERNAEARAQLKPLAEGERPAAVTAGAIVSALLAIVFSVSAVLAAAGVEVGGRDPEPLPIIFFAAVLWLMAWDVPRLLGGARLPDGPRPDIATSGSSRSPPSSGARHHRAPARQGRSSTSDPAMIRCEPPVAKSRGWRIT
jgi:hypothetical protein